jgi:hypothetical protein
MTIRWECIVQIAGRRALARLTSNSVTQPQALPAAASPGSRRLSHPPRLT